MVQRHDGVGAQGTKAHGRHIEQAQGIGLGTVFATHLYPKIMAFNAAGCHRMRQPFIALGHHIQLRSKRAFVRLALGSRIHQAALGT